MPPRSRRQFFVQLRWGCVVFAHFGLGEGLQREGFFPNHVAILSKVVYH